MKILGDGSCVSMHIHKVSNPQLTWYFTAGAIFGYTPNKVLSKDAAEIDNANLLRQNDHLYLIDDQIDAQEPDYIPEGIDHTQLVAGLERVVLALSNKID
jgi:hypothetical protein